MPTFHESKLKTVMARIFEIAPDSIDDRTSPDSVERWDSLRHMALVLALEQEFDIELTDEQVVEILSYRLIRIVLEEHGVHLA